MEEPQYAQNIQTGLHFCGVLGNPLLFQQRLFTDSSGRSEKTIDLLSEFGFEVHACAFLKFCCSSIVGTFVSFSFCTSSFLLSQCTATCGKGQQWRQVSCVRSETESVCTSPKPSDRQECSGQNCPEQNHSG